jgi:hypothetical protein
MTFGGLISTFGRLELQLGEMLQLLPLMTDKT